MKNSLKILVLFMLIVSCSSKRISKTYRQGEVIQKNYLEEVPFFYYKDLIILKLKIDEKEHNFIFDTGNDLTSIDKSLIPKINIKSNNVKGKVVDAKNIKSRNKFISIDNIRIGKIKFSNIGAMVFDHSPFNQFFANKFKISGVIGSNLMRKVIWQIDYEKKIIRLSDKTEVFDLSNNNKLKTNSGIYGNAEIEIKLNNIPARYIFDTGSASYISTDFKTFNKLNSIREIQSTKALITIFTANGVHLDETIFGYINDISLGNMHIQNQIIDFNENYSNLIGNKFLKDYLVTLDWERETFYLKPIKEVANNKLINYEYTFGPNYKENGFSFFNQWVDHKLDKQIELNSKILSINNIKVDNLSYEQLNTIWESQKDKLLTKNVEIEILENNKKRKVTLTEKQLLPK